MGLAPHSLFYIHRHPFAHCLRDYGDEAGKAPGIKSKDFDSYAEPM